MNKAKRLIELMSEETFKPGDRVQLKDSAGVDSNKLGVIVDRSEVRTSGRGVPTNVQGAYKPVDWSREVVIKLDDGNIITMFKNLVRKV